MLGAKTIHYVGLGLSIFRLNRPESCHALEHIRFHPLYILAGLVYTCDNAHISIQTLSPRAYGIVLT